MKLEKELIQEEIVSILKNQKVLNGRVFDYDILTKPGMCNLVDAVQLKG